MEIGSVRAAEASSLGVELFNRAKDQQEQVIGKLLESVKKAPEPGKGKHVDLVA